MKGWRLCLMILLLMGLLGEAGPRPGVAQTAEVRAGSWTQSGAEAWRAGSLTNLRVLPDGGLALIPPDSGLSSVGSYTTAAGTADWLFTHLVARWVAEIPEGTALIVEISARSQEGEWTAWMPLFDPQESDDPGGPANRMEAQEGIFGENILALRQGYQMRARLTFVSAHPQLSPVLRSISLIYLDASQGPTTAKAVASAEVLAPKTVNGVPSPAIISRAGWGANESWMTWPPSYSPVRKIVVHHTVTENDEPDPAATVRAIYYYHAIVRGWGDIGYNFLIDRFGNVYEGRSGGLDVIGGHAYGYNVGSLGIGNLGTFGNTGGSTTPTQAMLDAISELSAWTASRRLFHPLESSLFYDRTTPNITGHRDYGTTACPGDFLYAELQAIREAAWTLVSSQHSAYWVAWGSHSVPARMLPGSTAQVQISVENAGTLVWPAGGSNPVRLGYHWFDASGQPVTLPPGGDHRSPLPADASFGAELDWTAALLTAPELPGHYSLRWDMVHEGISWFGDQGSPVLALPVEVIEIAEQAYFPAVVSDSRTPTPTPPPPVPDPTPSPCEQLVVNSGFEDNEGWVLNDTPADAHYTTDPVQAGLRALRVGIPPGGENLYSYSSADQVIEIPSASQVSLSFWRYPLADDTAGDFHYVMIQGGDGSWETVLNGRDNSGSWFFDEIDLSEYGGQTITLRFGTFNDGTEGISSMTVDEVKLLACP